MDEQALREALRSEAADQPFDPAAVDRAVERGRHHQRRRRTTLLAAVPVVALAVAGAGAAALTWLPGDPPAARSAADRPVRLLTQSTSPGFVFDGRLDGTLTVTDDGCVAITPIGSAVVPVAWPPEWTVGRGDDGRAVVYDPRGRPLAREGGPVGVGGATVNPAAEGSAIDPADPCALGSSRVFQVGDALFW